MFRKQWLLLLFCLLGIEESDCSLAVFNQKTYINVFTRISAAAFFELLVSQLRRLFKRLITERQNPFMINFLWLTRLKVI